MANLISKDGFLRYILDKFVTDEGGAPCCCDVGPCYHEYINCNQFDDKIYVTCAQMCPDDPPFPVVKYMEVCYIRTSSDPVTPPDGATVIDNVLPCVPDCNQCEQCYIEGDPCPGNDSPPVYIHCNEFAPGECFVGETPLGCYKFSADSTPVQDPPADKIINKPGPGGIFQVCCKCSNYQECISQGTPNSPCMFFGMPGMKNLVSPLHKECCCHGVDPLDTWTWFSYGVNHTETYSCPDCPQPFIFGEETYTLSTTQAGTHCNRVRKSYFIHCSTCTKDTNIDDIIDEDSFASLPVGGCCDAKINQAGCGGQFLNTGSDHNDEIEVKSGIITCGSAIFQRHYEGYDFSGAFLGGVTDTYWVAYWTDDLNCNKGCTDLGDVPDPPGGESAPPTTLQLLGVS